MEVPPTFGTKSCVPIHDIPTNLFPRLSLILGLLWEVPLSSLSEHRRFGFSFLSCPSFVIDKASKNRLEVCGWKIERIPKHL